MSEPEALPSAIGRPATRALQAAGFTDLSRLAGVPPADLLRLHGVGPKAVAVLHEAMAERGLALG